jgi:ATP-dependent Clp protease ATP-binding subunit ClpA
MSDAPEETAQVLTSEDFRKALAGKMGPALLERMSKVVHFDGISEKCLAELAGHIMGSTLGTEGMTKDEKSAIGGIALDMAKQEGYDPAQGARHLHDAVAKAAAKPLSPDIEGQLCDKSPAIAKKVNGRRADALAEGFKTGVDAKGMKPLRLVRR